MQPSFLLSKLPSTHDAFKYFACGLKIAYYKNDRIKDNILCTLMEVKCQAQEMHKNDLFFP